MASSSALHDCPAPYTWLWHKHLYSHLSPHLLLLSPLLTLIQIHYFSNMSNIIIPRTIFCSIWSLLQHHCGFLYSFLPGLFWKCTLLMMLLHLSLLVLTLLLVCFIVFHCADHFSVFFFNITPFSHIWTWALWDQTCYFVSCCMFSIHSALHSLET